MQFQLSVCVSGWEESVTDAQVMDTALKVGLDILEGYYYFGDVGYPPSSDKVLSPYCGVWYHLAEWSRANQK